MPSRRTWVIAGTLAGVVVVGAVAGPLVYAALQEDAAPAQTVQVQESDAPLSEVTDGTWTVGAGSSAGYRVDEVLNGADVTVAGTTDQVSGSVVVSGGDLQSAQVDVDMASVATDSDRRDSYFRENVVDVADFPTATFAVDQAVDLPELTGTPVTVPVDGTLTVRGVTQDVTVDLSVVRTADGVQASGSIPVAFADYDITPPDLGFVSVEDSGSVEFFLSLVQ
ncbi:YceI family protein [Klenkia brasiliensis]|uniref:Polyisoprenoid-binding protein YceI n=1 Tax=Klenkia brasiliensis TaxID=333142 RepID=A0A1G7MLH6_9ACTN|nr:YceI family protein [Klenkia brasiliensis]SDF62645.1 Polyisoprenoid-binding protein YceI [Klenkia brasiliensis]